MVTRTVTIKNRYGIHCRPSTEIAKEAQKFDETITVQRSNNTAVSAQNVLQLIGLGLACGDQVTIKVEGPREQEVADRLAAMFATEFEYVPNREKDANSSLV